MQDTSPDSGLVSPLGPVAEEGASFVMVAIRAAEVRVLQLPSIEVETNLLTEVL